MTNLSEIDQYLYDNPELIERFTADNTDLFKAIKQRFAMYLRQEDVVARYLMQKALNDLVKDEVEVSKSQIRTAAFEQCGLILMDDDGKGVVN